VKFGLPIRKKTIIKEQPSVRINELYEKIGEVNISHDSSDQFNYVVKEPALTSFEDRLLHELEEILADVLDVNMADFELSRGKAEEYLLVQIDNIVKKHHVKVNKASLDKIKYYLVRNCVGYGKIDLLMRDPDVEDISCNGPRLPIYVWHRKYESLPTNITFSSPTELDAFAVKLVDTSDRSISLAQPVVDANLPDGSRLNVTYAKEITPHGSSFTIRKFKEKPMTITDLIANNTISSRLAAWFWYIIEHQASLIVVGGTASGKTTTINALSMFIKPNLKIVSIEDTSELQLPHENWLSAVIRTKFGSDVSTDITLFDLLKNAMRQRPDYVIVGEVRGSEAYTLFQAIATGHGGLSTFHGESVEAAVRRFENEPLNIPRPLMTMIDAMVIQKKVRVRGRMIRRISVVSEISLEHSTGQIKTNNIFEWSPQSDDHIFYGKSWILQEISKSKGISYQEIELELARRKDLLEWMVRSKLHDYRDVVKIIRKYYANPFSVEVTVLEA
jgi:flagellar protein FlaI